ncbi:MAG TPA: serine/threonine-protein kinase, partial [Candidatus Sulfopaludibacter sp.]|nr:serine/threonine-protein kinase [Candidatus Sulfopaludibacter sp.]
NQRALERFEREARTAAGLKHPNIVAIYDFGPLPAGGAYLVMELIRGCSWREELKTGESIALGRVSQWLEQLCAATTSAHALGIVHRDLKPENVMIAEGSPEERVVVLDFGLAKARIDGPRAETELTVAGSVLGTRAYMSPEQRAGEPIDVRTDVYSIAVMAVETLCGVAPPRTGASREWMRGALAGLTAPGSPLTLVLEQALAEIPADRLVSARELGAELVRAIPGSLAYRGSSSGDASSDTISLEAGTDRAE